MSKPKKSCADKCKGKCKTAFKKAKGATKKVIKKVIDHGKSNCDKGSCGPCTPKK